MDLHWLFVPFFVWILSGETLAEERDQDTQRDADQSSRYALDYRRDRRYTSYSSSNDGEDRYTGDRDRNRERGTDRDRGYDSNGDRGFDSNRDRGNDRNRGQNGDSDRNRGTSLGYESDRNRENSSNQSRDRNRGIRWNDGTDRNRETGQNYENDRNREIGWNNGNDRNRETGRNDENDRNRGTGWNTGNDRNRESDRNTENNRDNDRNRENNHYPENNRNHENDRDRRNDRDRDRKKNGNKGEVHFPGLADKDVKEQLVRTYWPWIDQKFPRPVQSPVAISTKNAKKEILPVLSFENFWENTKELITLRNDGNTVQVLVADDITEEDRPKISGGPLRDEYLFEQMHMHWGKTDGDGSEHTLNGKAFSTEMHIVHFKKEYGSVEEAQKHYDGIAVVAFFGTATGRDNKALGGYINDLERVRKCNSSLTIPVKRTFECVKDIAAGNRYYAYPGSLTTSPFSESVIWIVFPDAFLLSSRQLNEFRQLRSCDNRALIRKNDRELQPFNDRPVIFAF